MAYLIRVLALALLPLIAQSEEQQPLPFSVTPRALDISANLCEHPPRDVLCGVLPHDVTGFTASEVYMLIERSAQDPFDLFAWKSFVALNWPSGSQPMDSTAMLAASGPRVWESWAQPNDVFPGKANTVCDALADKTGWMVFDNWHQADGSPLVDQRGNYLVYDVRINAELSDYIRQNGLDTVDGQRRFQDGGETLSPPMGFYDHVGTRIGGKVGSIAIKSAWTVVPPAESDANRYVINGLMAISDEESIDGVSRCMPIRAGMVGLHIMRRTQSANGDHWIWATFEHDGNAPYSDYARGPNNIFADELFPQGCAADAGKSYLLFEPACKECPTNRRPDPSPGGWKWSSTPPYARYADGDGIIPAQISRCWLPAISTREMNAVWKEKLAGTVWANYSLATTQWKGAPEGALFPFGEVPRYLTNATMESFLQSESSGSCLGCHGGATTLAGQNANGSFLFLNATD